MTKESMRAAAESLLAEARAEYPGEDLNEVLDSLIDAVPDLSPIDRRDLLEAIWELA